MADGRFAPSPTGDLHLGNLRTAMVAWLFARASGGRFVVRMEDLDRVTASRAHEQRQLVDLGLLGIDHDGGVVRQSERFDRHLAALDVLVAAGLTYECWCTRREIREAVAAPHGTTDRYPGTCRDLTRAQRDELRRSGRPAAIRLRAGGVVVRFVDAIHGPHEAAVDDIVLRRNDGVPAYHLAVVVDDAAQGVQQVVRGDDLLASTPAQLHLAGLLGLPAPSHAHVPLVLGPTGQRLTKRDGAVTLGQLAVLGVDAGTVRGRLAASLGLVQPHAVDAGGPPTMQDLLERFDPSTLPRAPWRLTAADLA